MNTARGLILIILFASSLAIAAGLSAQERSEVKAVDKWDLTPLYKDLVAFQTEKKQFIADTDQLAAHQGQLGKNAESFKKALDLYYDLERRMRKMESYVSRRADVDIRVSENNALNSEVESIRASFAKKASFIDPEITAIEEKRLKKFFQKEPELKIYEFPISETLRQKAHILTEPEEKILAAASDIAGAGHSTYSLFTNADMPRNSITLEDGAEVKMTYANFDKTRRSLVEADRVKAFEAFFAGYDTFKRTLAETLHSQIKTHRFYSTTRNYESTLDDALDGRDIDKAIYMSLIEAAHQNLPTFHRYLKLKARALGKEKMDYADMYVPFTAEVKIDVPYDQAQQMLIESFAPLGEEYVGTIKEAFTNNWVDVYPNEGKRSGAYSSGWDYDAHPFILMNYNDTFDNVLTLAHEFGHAMHSYNSNRTQPFPTASYATFVAEVASTFNENLLNDYMLNKVASDQEKLYLLGNFLDGSIKGTFFRQIQFAEFELLIHQKVENGEPLTDEVLNKMYLELVHKYYGYDEGVINIPDLIAVEWAAIPHFYYGYYVFQYSTSIAAASLLSEKVINKQPGALDSYFSNLLKAGGSDNPVKLLQLAGADMTKPEAYDALISRANRYMDEIEKILDKAEAK